MFSHRILSYLFILSAIIFSQPLTAHVSAEGLLPTAAQLIDDFTAIDPTNLERDEDCRVSEEIPPPLGELCAGPKSASSNGQVYTKSILGRNLNNVPGGSRLLTVTSVPNGIASGDVSGLFNTVYGNLGYLLSSAFGGFPKLELLYDGDGDGLNIDISQSDNIIINLLPDHQGSPLTVVSVTLTDNYGSFQKVERRYTWAGSQCYLNGSVVEQSRCAIGLVDPSTESVQEIFPLQEFDSVNLSNVRSIEVSYLGDYTNDTVFYSIMVDSYSCALGYVASNNYCEPLNSLSGNTYLRTLDSPLSEVTVSFNNGLSTLTAINGAYTLSVVNGDYFVTASKPGYILVSQTFTNPVTVQDGPQGGKDFIFDCAANYSLVGGECVPVYSITGHTYLKNAGTPLPGVAVSTNGAGTSSQNDGTFQLAGLPNGTYTITASQPGYILVSQTFTNPVTIQNSSQGSKDFIFDCVANYSLVDGECVPVYSITGYTYLKNAGTPLPGVVVTGGSGLGLKTSTSDGGFSFSPVLAGAYTLNAVKPGFIVVSTSFSNPVIITDSSVQNINFILDCPNGFTFKDGQCITDEIKLTASDNEYYDYVLVNWTASDHGTEYQLYRSEIPGQLGEKLDAPVKGTEYRDSSAVPDKKYYYTVISNDGVTSNQDEGWRAKSTDTCEDNTECIDEELNPRACANANAFLGQINVATVINRYYRTLKVRVEYRDLDGVAKDFTERYLEPTQKMDFLINELGLVPDTYGTVCVTVDTEDRGAWLGGMTLYKTKDGVAYGNGEFDFVLYYPFTNPRTGEYTLPLNTFHLGVRSDSTIANWIRITDAEENDGQGLRGSLKYYNAEGKLLRDEAVNIADGGRFDFSGHEGLFALQGVDAVGMAKFTPAPKSGGQAAKYYISLGRYFYNCFGAACNDFYTALILPHRPSTNATVGGGVSTVNDEISVVEFNNGTAEQSFTELTVYTSRGSSAGKVNLSIPARSTRHVIVNKNGELGFLGSNEAGAAEVHTNSGVLSSLALFYKLDKNGTLEYAYSAPLTAPSSLVQFGQFNSFIGNTNTVEFNNSGSELIAVQLIARDAANQIVLESELKLDPKATKRVPLILPPDTYGTLIIQSDKDGLLARNYVARGNEYVLTFTAR